LDKDIPDLVCFTGGEDVSPDLYGEEVHPQTFNSKFRDAHEQKLFKQFLEANIPMVGICRGGQFLNVMNGGKMYQHVNMHVQSHMITDVKSGATVLATSTHHQMMRPSISGKIIATAQQHGFKQHMKEGRVESSKMEEPDIEAVFYPHTRCLCFQPHPEFGSDELKMYFINLIFNLLDI
jgi:gamma-glutamyl-gamma-aminobutyrate hydrolase PuuD